MFNTRSIVLACSVAVVFVFGIAAATTGHASGTLASKTMYLTVNTPIGLPGVGLAPGTYIFELANPDGDPSIVHVLSRDRLKVYYMGFTHLIARPAGQRVDRPISFGEARPGAPLPVAAWYPANESTGRRFIYSTTSPQLITDARN